MPAANFQPLDSYIEYPADEMLRRAEGAQVPVITKKHLGKFRYSCKSALTILRLDINGLRD